MIIENKEIMEILCSTTEIHGKYFHPRLEEIREGIINRASNYLSELKSPVSGKTYSINGEIISFSYERNISHEILESKFNSSIISCAYHKTVFFNSGISAIYNIFISIKRIMNKENLNILSTSSYFETGMINNVLMANVVNINSKDVIEHDVIFIETIDYNCLHYNSLVEIFQNNHFTFSKDKVTFIVVDSTLFRDKKDIDIIIEKFLSKNVIFIEVMSLIKFYQLGMELSNAGSITIYSHESMSEVVNELASYLKKVRNISGSNLSLYEIALLSDNTMLDIDLVEMYRLRIYKNARRFYNFIDKTDSIFNVIYPENGRGEAPFIILKNEDYKMEDYLLYCSLLKKLIEVENIGIFMGSSFGFNHTRFELIITNEFEDEAFIKISIGAFDENSQASFALLINRIKSNEKIKKILTEHQDLELLKVDNSD
ncbi:hypothetical protein [Streptococcus ruminantium]|uniref:hypothetical protein n=1 Tax=Streptococcus ruminantium TaxID=1917441 RepID=UPI00280E424F|nr:hypothetical protein [Streptococcus ruminantium]MDQ8837884.1 hypothetical protein [Streptococcus ruminantium]